MNHHLSNLGIQLYQVKMKSSLILWKDVWGGTINYFSNVGFDSGVIALNFLNRLNMTSDYLDDMEGPVTGFILESNGYVEKPIEVMQLENLGELKRIDKCSRIRD